MTSTDAQPSTVSEVGSDNKNNQNESNEINEIEQLREKVDELNNKFDIIIRKQNLLLEFTGILVAKKIQEMYPEIIKEGDLSLEYYTKTYNVLFKGSK
jgi:polyhydroxyalkanoate synthesis regulator phasin